MPVDWESAIIVCHESSCSIFSGVDGDLRGMPIRAPGAGGRAPTTPSCYHVRRSSFFPVAVIRHEAVERARPGQSFAALAVDAAAQGEPTALV